MEPRTLDRPGEAALPYDTGEVDPGVHDEIPAADSLPRPRRFALLAIAIVIVLLIGVAFAAGYFPRSHRDAALNEEAQARSAALLGVSVQFPQKTQASSALELPGNIQPLQETSLYARTTGYLKKWYFDIGAKVKAGQVLAEIDAPDVDAQLESSRADLENARAAYERATVNLNYAQTTLKRYESLISTQSVTAQEIDQYRQNALSAHAAAASAKAAVDSDQAKVKQFQDMVAFEKVTAPFDGTITVRNYDVGALIAANGTGGVMPLFRLAETDVLRVWVNVPQSYATAIHTGLEARLSVREYPDQTFAGKVSNTAGALDTATRTLLTEVQVPNPDGKLISGMFSEMIFQVTRPAPPLLIPAGALIESAEGNQVAIVGSDDVVHYRKIEMGRDFGTSIEITSGLHDQDQVVTNPGERLSDGIKVRILRAATEPSKVTR
jgi:RND family efflux transporter MFP subunit